MHFRVRGNAVQLVRTGYDAEKKGAKSEVVGRVPRRAREVPEDLKAKLTSDEMSEFTAYLEQTRAIEELQRKVTAHTLRQTVADAVAYAQDVADEAERDQLRAIFAEAVMALRRASHAREGGERAAGGGERAKGAAGRRGRDTDGAVQAEAA